jgi:hypothetical protein
MIERAERISGTESYASRRSRTRFYLNGMLDWHGEFNEVRMGMAHLPSCQVPTGTPVASCKHGN